VAVKVFRLDITPEQAHLLADALSGAADAGLFHPSIVEPIAAGVEGTVAYRAEEYVAAETLDVALRHYAPAPVEKALPFITQLAGAIDFARAAGIGHGALHPRDIFVTPEEARATGFGVVNSLERVGLRAPVRRPYSAPERIEGGKWSTPADVFSLAAIAYELLTGRRPSGPGPGIGTMAGASVGDHAASLLAVLEMAMDADPSRRHPTALAFAAALEAAARGERSAVPVAAAAAPTLIAAAAESPSADDVEDVEDEEADITGERDEDELHQELLLRERERAAEAQAATLFAEAEQQEEDPEAEADRLLIDAAAVASDEPSERFREDFVPPRPIPDPQPTFERRPEYRPVPAVVPAQGSRVLPLAAMLSIGLLVGFAVGYGVNSRDSEFEPVAETTDTAPPEAAAPPKDFSEQAVAQAPASSVQPPATPPPIPTDVPERTGDARPVPTTGAIRVESVPTRAGVVVNGRWRGRTPLSVDKLPFGKYVVRIVQAGYVTAQENVILNASDPTRTVEVRLNREQPTRQAARPTPAEATPASAGFTGSIYVDSRPRGARVFVDNKSVGNTPLSLPDVPVGSHVVRLELPDHRAWSSSTRVTVGETVRVTGSLERVR
jgi:hypothetical protein